MSRTPEDDRYAGLLRAVLLRVLAPVTAAAPGPAVVRGVVRSGRGHARVILAAGRALPGIALEVPLGGELVADVGNVLAVARRVAVDLQAWRGFEPMSSDSHGNRVVGVEDMPVADVGTSDAEVTRLVDLLTVATASTDGPSELLRVEGFLWVAEGRCRVYLRTTGDDVVGVELPVSADRPSSTFAQELSSIVRSDNLRWQPLLTQDDEYCLAVYDLTRWVEPPPVDPRRRPGRTRT